MSDDLWADVVGQERAVSVMRAALASPVHAYMLVGPSGCGKRALARAFAAGYLSHDQQDRERHIDLALREIHPDLTVIERVGAAISADQADEIISRANRAPVEGGRKVLVLDEFHLVADRVGPKLLKTIEEPPAGTCFVVLAEAVPPSLVTLASRCVRVDLDPLSTEVIADRLCADGVDTEVARRAAGASGGDLRRARVLAVDERLELRRQAWWKVPDRLDGTGSSIVVVADELLAMTEDAMAALLGRQQAELEDLEGQIAASGARSASRKEMVERHKREQRRYRIDDIRFGLATLVARYRERVTSLVDPGPAMAAIAAIGATAASLVRNPNERLALQALLITLDDLTR